MSDIRSLRQWEGVEEYLNSNRRSILNAAPRFGKIKSSIDIMKCMQKEKILIAFPRNDIKVGWEKDFKKWGFDENKVEFVTYRSLKHKVKGDYDFFIADEIQEASPNELRIMDELVQRVDTLGLSGTITKTTEKEILKYTGLTICFKYSIEQAVNEGILTDYQIFVHEVDLDDKARIYSSKTKTEKKYFGALVYRKEVAEDKKDWNSARFLELKQIGVIQNSIAKLRKTRQLINQYEDQRLLIFTGLTDIANQLEVPVYHSKIKDRKMFLSFCEGEDGFKHCATVKMMQAGITVSPIHKGILNYISGSPEDTAQKICRFLGFEYDNVDKKASLHIISSREPFERWRIKTALSFFEESKITYI